MFIKTMIVKIIKNLVAMAVTKKMIFWALEIATKQTDNKVDDNVVDLVKAAYEADSQKFQTSVEKILKEIRKD